MPSQRYVFTIFKNGRSSFHQWANTNHAKIFYNQQIIKLKTIDVILRDPDKRLLSGINTYIQHTIRDNNSLDPHTVEWFAINYFWLNNHYASQLSWLLSLSRYLDSNALIRFLPMSAIHDIIKIHRVPPGIAPPTNDLIKKIQEIKHLEMYQRLDRCLINLISQNLTWKDTLRYLQQQDSAAYDYVVGYTKSLVAPLYVLS